MNFQGRGLLPRPERRYGADQVMDGRTEMNFYTDKRLMCRDEIFEMIERESERQIQKWGIQTHTAFEWLTYTAEELGSLAKAISEYEYRNGPKEKVISEAIQVATLVLKIAEMYMLERDKMKVDMREKKFCEHCMDYSQVEIEANKYCYGCHRWLCGKCYGAGTREYCELCDENLNPEG